MATEYMANYEKENLRQIRLKINRKTEPELLEWIEKQENIQGYIKRIIRQDMKIEGKKLVICKECDRRGTYDCPVHIGCATDGDNEPDNWFCGDGEEMENNAPKETEIMQPVRFIGENEQAWTDNNGIKYIRKKEKGKWGEWKKDR